jgi:predicted AAA+ superfamily ATPase
LISKKKEILYYLEKYLELGGFPEVCLEKNEGLKRQLLRFYYDSIVYRDIVKRREIRNVSKMEKMINFLLANMGNPVNFHNMSKLVGLSTDTVVEYVKYMEDAFFIFPVPVFSYSIKSQEISPKKVYCIDTGIRSTVGFKFSEDYGRTVENIVFVELKRRFSSNPLVSIFYWKSKKAEVDFVIKNGLKIKELIQVCWNVEDKKTKEREVESLVEAMKEFKLKEGLVITEDYENLEVVDKKKIRFVPLWKWLLT